MRRSSLADLSRRARSGRSVESRAVEFIADVFVARIRCLNLRCRARDRIGFRRAEEWVDWSAAKCGSCGRSRSIVREEFRAVVEVNAPAKVLRFRREGGGGVEYAWEYVPFAFLGDLGRARA